MLKKAGILETLEMVVSNQDVSSPKPDPEGYLKIMSYFNFSPKETLIIEDSPKGIEAAEKSGSNLIKVKNQEEVAISLIENFLKGFEK